MTENERQKNTDPTPGLGRDQTLAGINQQERNLGKDDGANNTSDDKDWNQIITKESTGNSKIKGSSFSGKE